MIRENKEKLITNKVAFREAKGNTFSMAEGVADMSSLSCFIWICRCWQLASTFSASFRFMWRTIKAKRNRAGWRHVATHSKGLNGFWGSYSQCRSRHRLWLLVGHEMTQCFFIIHQTQSVQFTSTICSYPGYPGWARYVCGCEHLSQTQLIFKTATIVVTKSLSLLIVWQSVVFIWKCFSTKSCATQIVIPVNSCNP